MWCLTNWCFSGEEKNIDITWIAYLKFGYKTLKKRVVVFVLWLLILSYFFVNDVFPKSILFLSYDKVSDSEQKSESELQKDFFDIL